MPLKEWLEHHIWPAENKWLSPDFIRDSTALACLEMLRAGITAFCDMYFFEDIVAETARSMGMRAVLGSGVLDHPTRASKNADDCLRQAEEQILRWKGDELIVPAIAPHAAYTCSPETLEKSKETAERHGALVHIHLSETRWEVEDIKAKYGMTPAFYFDRAGLLDEKVIAAHCVWLTDGEMELLAAKGVGVSHCVKSNLKLASGIAPVPRMVARGIKVSLGTDGAASNNVLDIMEEMSTAARVHKAASDDPTAMDARTVMLMATKWGAGALGLEHTGSLEEGRAADVVVLDLEKPHLVPLYSICSHLVYSARSSDVETVMVNGRVVVKGGRLVTADEEEILGKAKEWGRKIQAGTGK
jgi:5-methylthioadenosine/S-adenosylhomocysteine deaminase